MTLHREGKNILINSAIILTLLNIGLHYLIPAQGLILQIVLGLSIVLYILFLQFFRMPSRDQTLGENLVVSPADGKVVVIEQTQEDEFFKEKRLMISVFMSPVNVHCNWYPVSGRIAYVRYHIGKYLVAWHPKASTENERTTIVIERENKVQILVRQIAGALAKRIVYYPHENDMIRQGAELGFIKFGSRVDVYLPLNAKVNVQLGQKSIGGVTVLAELPS